MAIPSPLRPCMGKGSQQLAGSRSPGTRGRGNARAPPAPTREEGPRQPGTHLLRHLPRRLQQLCWRPRPARVTWHRVTRSSSQPEGLTRPGDCGALAPGGLCPDWGQPPFHLRSRDAQGWEQPWEARLGDWVRAGVRGLGGLSLIFTAIFTEKREGPWSSQVSTSRNGNTPHNELGGHILQFPSLGSRLPVGPSAAPGQLDRGGVSLAWWLMLAVGWNTHIGPLPVAWASSQHGGWVPRATISNRREWLIMEWTSEPHSLVMNLSSTIY
ncbi:uncharacterized protein LOC109502329 [Felis catus]|uniref:uncharacterized protein LOC109502329 n=1 Tax=Felis catus TaxID=9685 RepID=UPI0009484454|nr:uncharacterized protein LOC109502329 [Felis catus]XP_044916303.1 uncharacterized protein LOC109502329 [Felis catus]XP_044916308.1 uncharacterized protein LOC109502329 [Felis catus]XP_044916315.1 uncharacterized protein LOC109502329 [Felis catus]XP_044916317.1 uncharacterized protein LOC109502329 [Felis catus]